MTAGAGGAAAAPDPTDGGRDPRRVPENWRELVDPSEWALNHEGLPFRRAARVIVLRDVPAPASRVRTNMSAKWASSINPISV